MRVKPLVVEREWGEVGEEEKEEVEGAGWGGGRKKRKVGMERKQKIIVSDSFEPMNPWSRNGIKVSFEMQTTTTTTSASTIINSNIDSDSNNHISPPHV